MCEQYGHFSIPGRQYAVDSFYKQLPAAVVGEANNGVTAGSAPPFYGSPIPVDPLDFLISYSLEAMHPSIVCPSPSQDSAFRCGEKPSAQLDH